MSAFYGIVSYFVCITVNDITVCTEKVDHKIKCYNLTKACQFCVKFKACELRNGPTRTDTYFRKKRDSVVLLTLGMRH